MSSEVETPEDIWGEKSGTSKTPAGPKIRLSSSRKSSTDDIASTGSQNVPQQIDLPSSRFSSIDQRPKTNLPQLSSNGHKSSSDTESDGSIESSNCGQSSASITSSTPELEKRPLFTALISFESLEFRLWDPLPFNAFLVKFTSVNLNWQFILVTGLLALLVDLFKWNRDNRPKTRHYPYRRKYKDFLILANFVSIVPDSVFVGILEAIIGQILVTRLLKWVGNITWPWKKWKMARDEMEKPKEMMKGWSERERSSKGLVDKIALR
jgi:hypothetical protein